MNFTKNYHTHTFRCKHASGDAVDYAEHANKMGMNVLGISDHAALPDNRWLKVRMHYSEREDYISSIELAQEKFPKMTILKSMECEFSKDYISYYKDELLGKYNFDYLVGAAHFFPFNGDWIGTFPEVTNHKTLRAYTDYMIESIQSGLFLFMAHPDAFGSSYLKWDDYAEKCSREILEVAESANMVLEINGYGFRKPKIQTPDGERRMYPLYPFWELAADYKIKVIINSDAHRPQDVTASFKPAYDIVKKFNLTMADFSFLERSISI